MDPPQILEKEERCGGQLAQKYFEEIVLSTIHKIYRCENALLFWHSTWGGAKYATPPLLFHGPYGIIIGHTVILGENVHIAQQVTIMQGEETTIIEDRVLCGAGCKILPGVHIGHDAKIGANAVVTKDVPACATVVLPPMRVIEQQV